MSTGETAPARPQAPDGEGSARVRAHPGLCEGWGECHRFAPSVFPLDGDGFVDIHVLAVPPELAWHAFIGASVCPERAITYEGPVTFDRDDSGRPL